MNTTRQDNQYYSEIINEGSASQFKNGTSTTRASRNYVNNDNTPKPDYIINQMSIDGRRQIEWGFPNSSDENGKYDASHCLPKSSGGSGKSSEYIFKILIREMKLKK
jgi:hypothetical protein